MTRAIALALACVPMLLPGQSRLTTRTLGDVATLAVPAAMKGPVNPQPRTLPPGRLSWSFASTYLWASMGSHEVFRQLLVASVMAPDATEPEYEAWPDAMRVSYEDRRLVERRPLGRGRVTVWAGRYRSASVDEPSHQYLYVDRTARLQLMWHVVDREVPRDAALERLQRIAESFRLLRDPVAQFAEQRDAPRREAATRAERLRTARAMLQREGHGTLVPGTAVRHEGVYLEWMDDPEPRFQLVLPLGRIRRGSPTAAPPRPRDAAARDLAGTVGWRAFEPGGWEFMNAVNDYLPLPGIAAALAELQRDPAYVHFYWIATVRVEEDGDVRRLESLRWFLDAAAEAQRRFLAGALAGPGPPERP